MSKSLNTFFASVFTLEDQDNIPYATPIQEENANTLDNIHITVEQVLNCLNELNVNNTPGPDTVSP